MASAPQLHPNWDQLCEIAAAQEGLFTTQQAAEAGYSPKLLLSSDRALWVAPGLYRLVYFAQTALSLPKT